MAPAQIENKMLYYNGPPDAMSKHHNDAQRSGHPKIQNNPDPEKAPAATPFLFEVAAVVLDVGALVGVRAPNKVEEALVLVLEVDVPGEVAFVELLVSYPKASTVKPEQDEFAQHYIAVMVGKHS